MASIAGDYSASLVSHWKLEEASGSRVDTPGSNDLSDNGSVGSATGKIGDAATFVAASSQFLSIADASQSGLDLGSTFSISFWIKLTSDPASSNYYGLISKDDGNTKRQYAMYYYNNGTNRQLWFYVFGTANASVFSRCFYNFNLSTGTWYHVLVTFDGAQSGAGNKIKAYLNGSAVTADSTQDVGGGATSVANSDDEFAIGKVDDGPRYSNMTMDEVSIWSGRVLSSSDASTIYNSGSGIPYDAPATASVKRLLMLGAG